MGQINRVDVFIDNQALRTRMLPGSQPESELQQYKRSLREQTTPGALDVQTELQVTDGKPGWQESANCLEVDPGLFFPSRGDSLKPAKEICRRCIVKDECLEYALNNNERKGVWGGTSERERRRMFKARSLAKRAIAND